MPTTTYKFRSTHASYVVSMKQSWRQARVKYQGADALILTTEKAAMKWQLSAFTFTCLCCSQSIVLQTNGLEVISKSLLFHTLQVNSKTFVVELLIKVESLVCFDFQSLSG